MIRFVSTRACSWKKLSISGISIPSTAPSIIEDATEWQIFSLQKEGELGHPCRTARVSSNSSVLLLCVRTEYFVTGCSVYRIVSSMFHDLCWDRPSGYRTVDDRVVLEVTVLVFRFLRVWSMTKMTLQHDEFPPRARASR